MKLKKADPAKIAAKDERPGFLGQLADAVQIAATQWGMNLGLVDVPKRVSGTPAGADQIYYQHKYAHTPEQQQAAWDYGDIAAARGARMSQVRGDGVYYSMPSLSGPAGSMRLGFDTSMRDAPEMASWPGSDGLQTVTPEIWRQLQMQDAIAERAAQITLGAKAAKRKR